MSQRSQSGSVTLVALCCVAVLGIALSTYLAVSNQAMRLSNRAYAQDVSRHLAEMGIERALRSFNNDTFSSWTHPDATTSTRTITITSSHYNNRFSKTEANVRVDRYMATVWNAAITYAVNDMVWYHGVWFHCIAGNTNEAPPNATYWTSAPSAWCADANYNATGMDIVLYGGSAYRCILANSNQVPPNAMYWTAYSVATWNAATSYAVNDVALLGGTAYRCISAHSNQTPPNLTYWISVPVIYSEGVATLSDSGSAPIKTQLHATIAPAPLFPNAAGATTSVYLASSGTVDSYNSVIGAYGGTNIGNSAVLAGGSTSGTAVTVTSARVNGYVAAPPSSSPPNAPLWSYGGSAILTSSPAPSTPSSKIDLRRVSRSPYIPQFDIQSVSGTGNLPNGTTYLPAYSYSLGVAPTAGVASPPLVYNVNRTYADSGGYYSGLYLATSSDILTIDGPVIINVTGSYFGMGAGKIQINPGGSLELYFSTSTQMYLGVSSGGGIDNQTNDPSKVLIASNHANNTVNYHYLFYNSGALPFCGTIYLPNAYLTVPNNVAIYGAISANNIRFTSAATLHYDTALRTAGRLTSNGGVDAPYMIAEWRELTDPNERAVLP